MDQEMAAAGRSEAVANPAPSAASPKNRRFLQFTTRQLLLLLALSGVLMAILAPGVHRTFRSWQGEAEGRRIAAANNDLTTAVRTNDLPLARRALEAGAYPDFMPGRENDRLIFACIAHGQIVARSENPAMVDLLEQAVKRPAVAP
jgi:hypothetical protein